ncbi:cilia- and flagella-associated protein 276 [Hetaerina americana]|uniref:cilia- and flagella-associated protein 276 n=1 Tax=Hetaerina americana TaxID=62018 RepID=UPI003A7F399D
MHYWSMPIKFMLENKLEMHKKNKCVVFSLLGSGIWSIGRAAQVVSVGSEYNPHWGRKLSPWERLHQHHTANSASQHTQLRRRKKGGGDALDFTLSSVYDHATYLFPNDEEIYRQEENLEQTEAEEAEEVVPPLHVSHEVIIGGVKERRSPHAVRLNLSSHHMSRTAGGYGRKVDGSFYAP